MLFLEGDVGDKLYENERISFDKLSKLFEVENKFDFIRKEDPNARVEFEYHATRKKMKGGFLRHPSGWKALCTLKGTYKGRMVRITYAESERVDQATKVRETLPRKFNFGKQVKRSFQWNKDRELILWLALNPLNASSPLRPKGDTSPIVWDIVNREAEADNWSELATQEMQMRQLFLKEDIGVLTRKAKGMGLVFPLNSKPSVIRKSLTQSYEAHKREKKESVFYEKFNAAETTLAGSIRELIDKGFIVQTNKDRSGQVSWQWKAGLQESGVILSVQRGANPTDALMRHMTASFDVYDKSITRLLSKDKVSNNENLLAFARDINNVDAKEKEIPELTSEELVKELKHNDIIGYNTATKAVHFYNQNEYLKFLKAELYKVDTPKNWVVEFSIALEDKRNLEIKVALAEKLEQFRNQ